MNDSMIYTRIPFVNKPLSRIVFGTGIRSMVANEDVFDLLDAVYAAGINVYDSAALYGDAEASLGRWIKSRHLRDKVVILTKGANPSQFRQRLTPFDILSDIEDSFAKLQTELIDIFILHRDDPAVPVGPIVELLNQLHRTGRIGAFGGSNWTLERIQAANEYAQAHGLVPLSVCSPSFGLAECIGDPWGGSVTISGPQNQAYRDYLRGQQMPVFAYSSLGRGFFSGKIKSTDAARAKELLGFAADEYAYPVNFEKLRRAETMAADRGVTVAQIAFAWLMHQDLNLFGITSPGSAQHIAETTAALQIQMTAKELRWLNGDDETD